MTINAARFQRHVADYADAIIAIIASGGVLFVAAAGLILSYESLLDLALTSGAVNGNLAWLWPLTLDALAIVASLNVLWSETRQERDNYAWTLVIVFTALSVVFNATHAGLGKLLDMSPSAPTFIAAFVGVVPPIAAALSLHLVVRLIRRVMARAIVATAIRDAEAELSSLSERIIALNKEIVALTQKRDALKSDITQIRAQKRAKTTRAHGNITRATEQPHAVRRDAIEARRAAVKEMFNNGDTLSDIASRFGVSERTIQRDINQIRSNGHGHANSNNNGNGSDSMSLIDDN